jgi:Cu2+-exporting ATPase
VHGARVDTAELIAATERAGYGAKVAVSSPTAEDEEAGARERELARKRRLLEVRRRAVRADARSRHVRAGIIFLVFVGKYIEARARGSSTAAMRELLQLQPRRTRVRAADGSTQEVAIEDVRAGDDAIVPAGESIPIDGTVVEGVSVIDASMLTGEPIPEHVESGARVAAGTIKGNGTLVLRATAVGAGTALAQIVEIVRRAQGTTPPVQRLADKVTAAFVPAIIAVAALTFGGWVLTGHGWVDALIAIRQAAAGTEATSIPVSRNGLPIGALAIADRVRPQAAQAVRALHDLGLKVFLVSGDAEGPAAAVARETGADAYVPRNQPEGKAEAVAELQRDGAAVAFVGDGNDAPATGTRRRRAGNGRGTQIALKTAKAAIINNDVLAIPLAIRLSRATLRTVAEKLFWAFGYNVILVPLAAFGVVRPIFAAAAMGLPSLVAFTATSLRAGLSSACVRSSRVRQSRSTQPTWKMRSLPSRSRGFSWIAARESR